MKQTLKELCSQAVGSFLPIFLLSFLIFLYRTTERYGVQSNVYPGVVPVFIGIFSLATCLLGVIIETLLSERSYSLKQWFVIGASYSSILVVLLNPYAGALFFLIFNPATVRIIYGRNSHNKL